MLTGNELVHPDIVTDYEEDRHRCNFYANTYSHGGLTIRQHFASLFMSGILSTLSGQPVSDQAMKTIASESVLCADVLIEELNKPKP